MQRGVTSRGGASHGGRVSFRANHAVSDGCDAESATISPNELDEFRRWKEIAMGSQLNNQETTSSSNTVADAVHTDSGTFNKNHISNWILDSGASRHVTGKLNEFTSYTPYSHSYKGTIKTADGTPRSIRGIGTVQCTPNITLSSVLHVPSFSVNLISISSLIDQMDCRVLLDHENCLIQERRTGRNLGVETWHDGLWYLDRSKTREEVYFALSASEDEAKVMLLHCRLGHISFDIMSKMFPHEMFKVNRSNLMCDACEYGKHTRSSYVSRGLRSLSPFILIHSDVWTSPVTAISGAKYFGTIIDCYSHMTWVYLMKHKSEVLEYFKTFYAYVKNQFGTSIQII